MLHFGSEDLKCFHSLISPKGTFNSKLQPCIQTTGKMQHQLNHSSHSRAFSDGDLAQSTGSVSSTLLCSSSSPLPKQPTNNSHLLHFWTMPRFLKKKQPCLRKCCNPYAGTWAKVSSMWKAIKRWWSVLHGLLFFVPILDISTISFVLFEQSDSSIEPALGARTGKDVKKWWWVSRDWTNFPRSKTTHQPFELLCQ